MSCRNLVITGTAGFVGINFLSTFVESELFRRYNKVVSIDMLGYATEHTKEHYLYLCNEYNIDVIHCDINTLKGTNGLEGVTDVLDFASSSHVDNSINSPNEIFTANSMIPANLIEFLGIDKIGTYFHISTDEVYGDIPLEYMNDPLHGSFKTESPYKPSNPYSASKVAQDAYLESMSRTFGLNVVLIRMANQFGPFQHKEKMIPFSIYRLLNGETIKVYGDGKNCRQWTYVRDTVKIIADIIDWTEYINPFVDDTKKFQVIHLADQRNLLDNNVIAYRLVRAVVELAPGPCPPPKWIKSHIEYIKDRPGHDMMYCLAVDPLIQRYYKTSFEDAIAKTVKYYKELYGAREN